MNESKSMIWLSRMKAVEKMTISGVTHIVPATLQGYYRLGYFLKRDLSIINNIHYLTLPSYTLLQLN